MSLVGTVTTRTMARLEGTGVGEIVLYAFNCTYWAIVLILCMQPSSLRSASGHLPSISPTSLSLSSDSRPKFATTSAEFNLFPSSHSTDYRRKPQKAEIEKQECLGVGHLTTLRSAAFWELRRSVIENGECLIRRMRDYELSRLHQQIRQKARERKKRGHNSSTLRSKCKSRPNASDDDNLLIFSEDASQGLSSCPPLGIRTRFLDSMDVDGQDQDRIGRRAFQSIPGADYQTQLRNDEGIPITGNSFRIENAEADSELFISYPDSASQTPSSSFIPLPLPQSLPMTSDKLFALPTTSSEKALAELNVAFGNGACCITDYSPIWSYQEQFKTVENYTGDDDLWH